MWKNYGKSQNLDKSENLCNKIQLNKFYITNYFG